MVYSHSKDLESFFEANNLKCSYEVLDRTCSSMIEDMKNAFEGKKSSLPMISSYTSCDANIKVNDSVIVIDAGGTNLRTCLVTFDENKRGQISHFNKGQMPGFDNEVSSAQFFDILAHRIKDLINYSDRIGFCFSYPAKVLPDHDGIVLSFSKEIKAKEVIGKKLGEELLKELERLGYNVKNKKVAIFNDTVTTLLAGAAYDNKKTYDSYIGFILGTGTNTAYVENGTIINMESGSFNIGLGKVDLQFVQTTKDPTSYTFEKMISGAYLGPLSLTVLKCACKEGLLSKKSSEQLLAINSFTTIELSAALSNEDCPIRNMCCGKDWEIVCEIFTTVVKRSACYAAANLAAPILITEHGKSKEHPVLINADGTTFYKVPFLKETTVEMVETYLQSKGRYVSFVHLEDSPILGSAIGAMSF
ncbi:MAG: hexokinase [Sphaerochaetaceae bacterium]|nr:hexokinase [Sphaerochaetaceae bacterium]